MCLPFWRSCFKMDCVEKRGEADMCDNEILSVQGVHPPKTKVGVTKIHKLVAAAEKLFTQTGFFDVSVSDICREARTAVGTFYIYFGSKADIYRYLVEQYKQDIRQNLAKSIAGANSRLEMEREGIKCFVRYSVDNPHVYNIIWGSLAVDKQMFEDYYVSFANSYARALTRSKEELRGDDVISMAYMLMGVTNFLGLRAIFENLSQAQIDEMIDSAIMPILEKGMFR